MKRHVFAAAVLGAAAMFIATASDATAFGRRAKGGCAPACDSGCGTATAGMAVAAAGPGTADVCSAPAAPTFTTQTVTKYKTEYKTTKQKVTVNTTQWVDQPYEW